VPTKTFAAVAALALTIGLTGCPGDPANVKPDVNAKAFDTAMSLIVAVKHSSWQRACSLLTLEARIEIEAWAKGRQRQPSLPSCRDALAGPAFQQLCGEFWERVREGTTLYRKDDVGGPDSKPTVAWFAVSRNGPPLMSRCELRLTHVHGNSRDWRVDAIARTPHQAVLARRRNELVVRTATPVSKLRPRRR
jgi:hypothetical protein